MTSFDIVREIKAQVMPCFSIRSKKPYPGEKCCSSLHEEHCQLPILKIQQQTSILFNSSRYFKCINILKHFNIEPDAIILSQILFDNQMKEDPKSNSDTNSQIIYGLSVLLDHNKRAQINAISEQLLSPQAKKAEQYLEYSATSLAFNFLGFTAIRFARGMRPQLHEMRNRWSRPAYLFFGSATLINLLGTAFCTYDFIRKGGNQLNQIVDISKKISSKSNIRYNQTNQLNTPSIDNSKKDERIEQLKDSKSRLNQ